MITQDVINQTIEALKTKKPDELPAKFKQLDLKIVNGKLYAGNRLVISKEDALKLIESFDRDPNYTGGTQRLFNHLREKYYGISRGMVSEYLSRADVHQLHQPLPKKTTTRAIIPTGPNVQWQFDLIDLSNQGQADKYALTAIDCFTRYAMARPIKRKTGPMVAAALDSILNDMKVKPKVGQTDRGSEFKKEFETVLAKHGIKHVLSSPYAPSSQGHIERLNQDLKRPIFRLLNQQDSSDWVKLLEGVVNNHNNSIHSRTKRKPIDIMNLKDPKQIAEIKARLESFVKRPPSDRKFEKGDWVRLALTAEDRKSIQHRKGTQQNWSDDIYQIRSVSKPTSAGTDPQYLLSFGGFPLPKPRWAYELLKVNPAVIVTRKNPEWPRPKPKRRERLDRLSDDEYVPEKPIVVEQKTQTGRPARNKQKKIVHQDYVYA